MKLKRILAAVLALMTLLLAACNSNQNEDTDTAEPAVTIGASELSEYTVVVSEYVSDEEKAAVTDLVKKIYEKFGTMLKIVDDAISQSDKEILVGEVNREVTKSATADMKYDDYFLGIADGKLVVAGGSTTATAAAIQKLGEVVDANADSDIFFDNGVDMQDYKHSYIHEDIKINGTSVSEYTIMYTTGRTMREETLARAIRKAIVSTSGIDVNVQPDTDGACGNVIFVGGTAESSYLKADGLVIYVSGSVADDFFFAAQTLISRICDSSDDVTVGENEILQYEASELDLSEWGVSREKITVMTYNMQNLGSGQGGMQKFQTIASYIDEKTPDILAMQECHTSGSAAENLLATMKNKDSYSIVTQRGSTSGVMYNKEKFSLVDSGYEQIGWPNDENGSNYNIFMMWAMLESKATGERLVVQSVHIEYVVKANAVQLKHILDFMKQQFADVPSVLMGDFNLEEYKLDVEGLEAAGYANCAKTASKSVNSTQYTFPGNSSIIDYIFEKGMIAEYPLPSTLTYTKVSGGVRCLTL